MYKDLSPVDPNFLAELPIHETTIIQPTKEIPTGSEFRGYQDYTVQELIVRAHNIRNRKNNAAIVRLVIREIDRTHSWYSILDS
jgi:hypothetical protein